MIEHAAEFEPFYTSLVSILAYKLIERLNTCTLDQVGRLEAGSQVLLDYLLRYIQQRSATTGSEDADSALISSLQALSLIEGLLNAGGAFSARVTSKPIVELETLITILNSAKLPVYRRLPNDSVATMTSSDETKSNDNTIDSLISSFLSHDKVKSEQPPSSTEVVVVEEKKIESPVELFQRNMYNKFAASHDALKTILDLLASSLTYLNVYRKNHLKELRSLSSSSHSIEINSIAQLGCLSYDQAIQTRAKYLYFDFFSRLHS